MRKNDYLSINANLKIIRRGKKGLWCADFNIGNNHKRVSLKTVDQKTAIEMAEKMSLEIAKGDFKAQPAKVSLDSGVELYLRMVQSEERSRKTLVKYTQVLKELRGLLSKKGVNYLCQIDSSDFDDYRIHRKAMLSGKTVYNECVIFKQFMKFCKSRKLIPENPIAELRLNKPKANKRKAPSQEEVAKMLASVLKEDKIFILSLATTGMRSGELQRLQKEDVDLAGNWIHIVSRPGLPTKTGQSRKVPIHPILRKALEDYKPLKNAKWFFPGKGGKQGWANVKKLNDRLQKTLITTGLPSGRIDGYTVHSLRHFMESFGINHGVPQRAMDLWLGHTGGKSMSAIYYMMTDKESQDFMARLEFCFDSNPLSREA
ncbi:MAG: hypothetical protein DWI06_00275 [Planctomycetota bacterium]|nr:MAG: hypothetical protein DWI06_00275 [Planctomycetota bacterium]